MADIAAKEPAVYPAPWSWRERAGPERHDELEVPANQVACLLSPGARTPDAPSAVLAVPRHAPTRKGPCSGAGVSTSTSLPTNRPWWRFAGTRVQVPPPRHGPRLWRMRP
jgi:hypothetical protein